MITTLKLSTPIVLLPYQLQYSAIFRYSYERTSEGLNQKDIRALVKERWSNPKSNNEDSVNSWIAQCAILDAQAQYAAHQSQIKSGQRKNINVVWGGKGNLRKRSQGKLSSSEWHQLRLRPMVLQGEAASKSNRLFDFSKLADNILIYKPNKHTRVEIPFQVGRNQRKQIQYLIHNIGSIPIQVQLKRGQICLSFEQEKQPITINKLSCRILGIDQNPNYIGITIIDFKDGREHLVKSKVYAWSKNSRVNDNKRDHETKEIAHAIIRLARHYRVSEIGIEQLTMGARDAKKGRHFNRLVNNQWNRELFQWTITKLSDQLGIEVEEVNCAYSSTIGNLLHSELPDPCAAAWEIARRAHCKYQKSLCMYPPLRLEQIKPLNQWKKDGFDLTKLTKITSWVDLHNSIKNAKLKYRVQLSSVTSAVSRFSSTKSGILLYTIPACLY